MARSTTGYGEGGFRSFFSAARLKRLAIVVAIPTVIVLVLLIVLWNVFFKYVPPGKMLVIISKTGAPLTDGRMLADQGQMGIQKEVLGEGWHFVMPIINETQVRDNITIEAGKVGIVEVLDGDPTPEGEVLAGVGTKGIRREVLLPGSYRLNPHGYKVEQVPLSRVEPGYVGILRRRLGKEQGIQKDRILQPGIYPLNTKEFELICCDVGIYQTTYAYTEQIKDSGIEFQDSDGNTIHLDCTVEWEVKPDFWPRHVTEYPDIKMVERRIIDLQARSICRARGVTYGTEDFLLGDKREKFQTDFQMELNKECEARGIQVRTAFIRNIIIPEAFLKEKRDLRIADEQKLTSEALTLTQVTEGEVAEAQKTIASRVAGVEAETARLVKTKGQETLNLEDITKAKIKRLTDEVGAKIAILDAQAEQVLGEAEAEAKKLKETAEFSIHKMRMEVFGKDGEAYLRYTFAKELNPKLQLRLFQSGTGTFWTNMGNKNMNFMMPLNNGESKSPLPPISTEEKPKPEK